MKSKYIRMKKSEVEKAVKRLYRKLLDREVDTDGLTHKVNVVMSGDKTVSDVFLVILESPEYLL